MVWIGVFSFLAVALFIFALPMVFAGATDPLPRRLKEVGAGPKTLVDRKGAAAGPLEGLFGRAASLAKGLGSSPSKSNEKMTQWLAWAGFEGSHVVGLYMLLRLGGAVAVAVLAGLVGSIVYPKGFSGWIPLGAGILWLVLVKIYVDRRVKRRREVLDKSLPTVLDFMVVTVEAGFGLNAALVRVAEEIADTFPLFSRLMFRAEMEMRAGASRADSLRRLSWRTGLEDVKGLVTLIIQADQYGTSLADSLRVYSDTVRTKRRQRAEEQAAKTPVKLVFPLALFIFPAILIVLLGGALIKVYKELGPLFGAR